MSTAGTYGPEEMWSTFMRSQPCACWQKYKAAWSSKYSFDDLSATSCGTTTPLAIPQPCVDTCNSGRVKAHSISTDIGSSKARLSLSAPTTTSSDTPLIHTTHHVRHPSHVLVLTRTLPPMGFTRASRDLLVNRCRRDGSCYILGHTTTSETSRR